MDAMLQLVREERQLYSNNQCVKYMCTHSPGHNIDMNRAGNFGMSIGIAWALKKFYLRYFKSNFDAVKSKFGLFIE